MRHERQLGVIAAAIWIAAIFLGYLFVVGVDVARDLSAHSRRWSRGKMGAQRAMSEPDAAMRALAHGEKQDR